MTTVLVTGFGPFPGAPFNPTEAVVRHLSRLKRPALRDVRIVGHVFPTSYAAVDRDLPALIAKHKPDALLMFGVATRAKHLRVETRARNALALLPDATAAALARHAIAPGGPGALPLPAPFRRLIAGARMARVKLAPSRDAGRYLCNYLCWRAAEAAGRPGGPRLAAFVHVPQVARDSRSRPKHRHTDADLARAGAAILMAIAAAARR
ncbi:MAG: pyroglutamyl-peptidase I [Pseudolabrys sp.]